MDEELFARAKEIFNQFDTNGNGSIEASELKDVFLQFDIELTDETIQKMIKEADIDANGSIEFDEFFNLLTSFLNEIDGAGE